MTDSKSPAARGHHGRSVSVQLGGCEHNKDTPHPLVHQLATYREADAVLKAALIQRGDERLRSIAIAACLRNAAVQAGIHAGVVR